MVAAARPGLRLAAVPSLCLGGARPRRNPGRDLPARKEALPRLLSVRGTARHQSLGMLLTRRLERAGAAPLGFVANEYALAIWGLNNMGEMVRTGRLDLAKLFDEDMLGDDLDAWFASSSLMKRAFRVSAIISALL